MWIASENGNVGGRKDDFVFEAGKHYTFTVTCDDNSGNDCVDMTYEDDGLLVIGNETTISGITNTSYTLTDLIALTDYTVYVQSVKGDKTSEWSSMFFTTTDATNIGLIDDDDNSEVIDANNGEQRNVTLVGRTLYKDGAWNTLCLPFDVDNFTNTPLEGATVMELGNSDACTTGFDASTGTLTLDFVVADKIEAGHAYIVKWDMPNDYKGHEADYDVTNPVFNAVNISNEDPAQQEVVSKDKYVSFIGTYAPVNIYTADKTKLYLGADNKLYYPWGEGMTEFMVNSFRAYFQLHNGLVCGEPIQGGNSINAFVLNFGDGTNYIEKSKLKIENSADAWYDLSGRKLKGKPISKGIYINNGRKVVIK